MSNLYEICYLIMIGTASAAAFATGGSTLASLFDIPYWLCTVIVAAFIFLVALYGTGVVRKCASTLSVLIIIGLVLVLVPNIIAQWDSISASISRMSSGEMTVLSSQSGAFGPALWSAVLYFFFQLASVSVMYQHMESVTDVKQINRAALGMFLCNFLAMELSIVGLLAVAYVAELATASVPMLILVQNGVGAGILTPIISLLIILGAISTAVNMISGIVRERAGERQIGEREGPGAFSAQRCLHSDLYLPGLRHRPVRPDGGGEQGLRVPGLRGHDHAVCSLCGSCGCDEGAGDLI